MDKPGLLDWVIAPLTLLERVKGPKRLGILLLYAMTLLVVGVSGWRVFVLWRLPDIGEPFDVVKFGTVDVPDADNAMILYREAGKELIAPSATDYKVASSKAWDYHSWATADPEVRRWAMDNRPALDVWLKATERSNSLLFQPQDVENQSILGTIYLIRDLLHPAMLEVSRLEGNDDVAGVWKLHRAMVRSSRHAGMHGGAMQRLVGHDILMRARPGVQRWIDNPSVTPAMLCQAIADIEVCKAMTSPNSEMVRSEYFMGRSFLNDSGIWRHHQLGGLEGNQEWFNHISFAPETRHFLMREPERSRRVLCLITAGVLAQCDRPRSSRPPIVSRKYAIYDVNRFTPSSVGALTPNELTEWAERLTFMSTMGNLSGPVLARVDAETGIFDTFLLRMAERAYEIEHGKPPKTYADLLGPYLKTLPEGFEPIDHISASQDPE
jgi:hypothetical protein